MWPSVDSLSNLSDHQRETVRGPLSGRVGILAGTPGTGKTWTAAAIIKSVVAKYGAGSVCVCAPTGKAAVRVTAALAKCGVPIEAGTVHRTLGIERAGHDGAGWEFHYGEKRKLPYRYYFLDESSMEDTDMGAAFFAAIPSGACVLLVGDPYQLPPVGHGAVLRDLIAAGLPYGELTELQRNSGHGVRLCRDLKEGKRFWSSPEVNVAAGFNVLHLDAITSSLQLAKLDQFMLGLPPGIDRKRDVQIICTVNEKGDLSRNALNKRLQAIINPPVNGDEKRKIRISDKVICTRNGFLQLVGGEVDSIGPDDPKCYVANGEIGVVTRIDGRQMDVEFDWPPRVVRVGSGGEDGDAAQFELGYAITFHKSQGSQWPITVCLADDGGSADRVACRELWYTGLSRFEKLSVTIGKASTIDRQCRRVALGERKTFLAELVQQALRAA